MGTQNSLTKERNSASENTANGEADLFDEV
jgi:hypothetical protein